MQITIRMPDEFLLKLEEIAQKTGLKKSDITRMAIKKFIAEYYGEDNQALFERAAPFLGVAESGISDLGQNHRQYLINRLRNAEHRSKD